MTLTYSIEGAIENIRLPPARAPRAADSLWQHTCCEMFMKVAGAQDYYEFNFAPSGEWAVHVFTSYRQRSESGNIALDPQIKLHKSDRTMELNASISPKQLPPGFARARLCLALAAVIENLDGTLSYWALAHPTGQPNFHHPAAYTLELDEVRN